MNMVNENGFWNWKKRGTYSNWKQQHQSSSNLGKTLVGGLIIVFMGILLFLNALLPLRFFGGQIKGNQLLGKKLKYLTDYEVAVNQQKFVIIDTNKFDKQIGNVQKSAREYYEIREKVCEIQEQDKWGIFNKGKRI
eukprot:TRINITY_DN7469_c1_g1_i1.p2 TRINITY_DN7469_c1_g1~~TRINITY_DN7469_c1_g1_i1.p2  ORF type:complete len:136 (+),score=10.53 TRINITY_DN7469_c1_g1_i1:153-560(+)